MSRQEAIECFGKQVERWMRFFTSLRFLLIDKEKRLFQAERIVFLGYFDHSFHAIGEARVIEDVAREYGQLYN
jgi:hypothetical protein